MKKTILFCMSIFLISATYVTTRPKLYIIGDSTACAKEKTVHHGEGRHE